MRGYPDDPDVLGIGAPTVADLGPLWHQAPPAPAIEQRSLADEAFWRWAGTKDGAHCLVWIEDEALSRAKAGDRRIGVKSLVERCRDTLHLKMNNKYTALIARWLVDRNSVLQPLIEIRERA